MVEVLDAMRGLADDEVTTMVVTNEVRFAADVADRLAFMADAVRRGGRASPQVTTNPTTDRALQFLRMIGETTGCPTSPPSTTRGAGVGCLVC